MKNMLIQVGKYQRPFEHTFKMKLSQFVHPIFGFNVVEFDKALGVPGGTSTSDFVMKKYGKEAWSMILLLLEA